MNVETLKELGIVKGRVVNKALIERAEAAQLPELAVKQLWPTRTLNKAAMAAVCEACGIEEEPAPIVDNESTTADEAESTVSE